jgi:hypothetical protein
LVDLNGRIVTFRIAVDVWGPMLVMDVPWLAPLTPCAWEPTETNCPRGFNTGRRPWGEPGCRNGDASVFNLEAGKSESAMRRGLRFDGENVHHPSTLHTFAEDRKRP